MAKEIAPVTKPARIESRSCFALVWFWDEPSAREMDRRVRERGDTYNGGMMDGRPCGRDRAYDSMIDGEPIYAVTTA